MFTFIIILRNKFSYYTIKINYMMENSKRRRGISLSHQKNHDDQIVSLNSSVYTKPQCATRINYSRYNITTDSSRHASAPKSKIQFSYHINYPSYPVNGNPIMKMAPLPFEQARIIQNTPIIYKRQQTARHQPVIQQPIRQCSVGQQLKIQIPVIQQNFIKEQPAKQQIVIKQPVRQQKQLALNKQSVRQQPEKNEPSRQDRARPITNIVENLPIIPSQTQMSFSTKPSKQVQLQESPFINLKNYEYKIIDTVNNVSKFEQYPPIEIPQKYASFQDCKKKLSQKLFKQTEQKQLGSKIDLLKSQCMIKQSSRAIVQNEVLQNPLSTEVKENNQIIPLTNNEKKKDKFNLKKEVLDYLEEFSSKAPLNPLKQRLCNERKPAQKQEKISKRKSNRPRDMNKFTQMQKRLIQIIKICDQNI